MDTTSKQLYDKAKEADKVKSGLPWLKLVVKVIREDGTSGGVKGTGEHIVEFISDKAVDGKDYHTKEEIKEVEYTFKEDNEEKRYRIAVYGKDGNLHYLIERLKDFNYGDKIKLEYKRDGSKGFIAVESIDTNASDDDIPIIDDEPYDDNTDNLPEE